MNRTLSGKWILLAVVITTVWGALLLSDGLPLLRGPAPWPPEWRWLYQPLGSMHWERQLWQWSLLIGYLVAGGWLLRAGRVRWGVALAVSFLFLWQLVQTWVREQSMLDTLIFRAYAPTMNGYLLAPAQVQDVGETLRHYATALSTFFSEKPRTHPPGLFLLYALSNGAFERWADLSHWVASVARTWALPGRDWPQLPDHLITSAFVTAWLQVILTSLTPLGMFFFVNELSRGKYREWALWSALVTPFIPSLSLFLSQWDAVYPLLGLMAWFLALRGQNRLWYAENRWSGWCWLFSAGLVLGLLTWLSYGLLVMVGMVFLHSLWRGTLQRKGKITPEVFRWTILGLGVMLAGVAFPWLLGWLLWGMYFPELFAASLHQHFALVTHARQYAIWVWANGVDVALWLGPGLLLLGVVGSVWAWMRRQRNDWMWDVATASLAFWAVIILLDVSGVSRGEVGRLWLFLMPYPLAWAMLPDWSIRGRTVIWMMMGFWSVLVGWVIPPFGI